MNLINKISNRIRCFLFRRKLKGSSNKALYIIGNGFDLHHDLDTWYSSFGLFLQDNHSDIYDLLIRYVAMPELDREDEDTLWVQEWNEFEKSLANLDFDEIINDNSEFAASPISDDYHKDLGVIENNVSEIRDNLTINLFNAFKEFIKNVEYPNINEKDILNINPAACFFNFNYTNSLQEYYSVEDSNILYIHNNANSSNVLVLGHGIDPEKFVIEKPKMPANLSDEEEQNWIDYQGEKFDISIEFGKNALFKYFNQSFKNTETIIKMNQSYFDSLKDINRVIVFGHSLSDVDKSYFEKIVNSVNPKSKWFVSCRKNSEMIIKRNRLYEFGIPRRKISPYNVNWLLKHKRK